MQEVDNRASEDKTREFPLEPYLSDPRKASLVDKLISLAQKVYDSNKNDVAPGSFNPEFTKSATLFICGGQKLAEMKPVFGTDDLLKKIMIKVCLRSNVLSICTSSLLQFNDPGLVNSLLCLWLPLKPEDSHIVP